MADPTYIVYGDVDILSNPQATHDEDGGPRPTTCLLCEAWLSTLLGRATSLCTDCRERSPDPRAKVLRQQYVPLTRYGFRAVR